MALKVLYIHLIGAFGGSSRSLFEAVRALPAGEIDAYFVTQRGSVTKFFKQVGVDVIESPGLTQFDNTRYSFYRGVRWLVMLRELLYLPATVLVLWRARKRWGHMDLIHLNEFTGLIPMLIAQSFFNAPVVVHARSVARTEPMSLRTRWVNGILKKKVAAVVAIDENVRASLPATLAVDVIHNGFTPVVEHSRDESFHAKLQLLRPTSYKVGFVGNLLRVKGLYDLVEAARIVRRAGLDVEFIIVGENARKLNGLRGGLLKFLGLAQDVRSDLERLIVEYGLADSFHLMGFTTDIQRVYQSLDMLCFPSHYDAPGRPIFEAAFSGIPSVVAVRDPRSDTLIDGETGLAVPPQNPEALAEAIIYFASNPEKSRAFGNAARIMAHQNFDVKSNSANLLAVYRRCTGS
ncbi:MAG: glycosyl transferase family 1 [Burkholderiales bacterium RIFCSPLOWO2_02_FULL_57_36]|nr:MAG: glycosyl transferase family 1 [Burkholderiales bacterium RIFCSPLOWO2_02_FULL_57_36]